MTRDVRDAKKDPTRAGTYREKYYLTRREPTRIGVEHPYQIDLVRQEKVDPDWLESTFRPVPEYPSRPASRPPLTPARGERNANYDGKLRSRRHLPALPSAQLGGEQNPQTKGDW